MHSRTDLFFKTIRFTLFFFISLVLTSTLHSLYGTVTAQDFPTETPTEIPTQVPTDIPIGTPTETATPSATPVESTPSATPTEWPIDTPGPTPTIPVSTLWGDFYGDCYINTLDFSILLGKFGTNDINYDFNGDGIINEEDVQQHLFMYTSICSIDT